MAGMSTLPPTPLGTEQRLYALIYTGELLPGQRVDDVRLRIGVLYKLDEAKLARLFCGQRVTFMRGVDMARAQRHVQRFARLGARLRVEMLGPSGQPAPTAAPRTRTPAAEDTVPSALPASRDTVPSALPVTAMDSEPPTDRDTGPDTELAPMEPEPEPERPAARPAPEPEPATAPPPPPPAPAAPAARVERRAHDRSVRAHTHPHGARSHEASRSSRHGDAPTRTSKGHTTKRRSLRWGRAFVGVLLLLLLAGGIWLGLSAVVGEDGPTKPLSLAEEAPPPAASAAAQAPAMASLASLPSDEARTAFVNEFTPAPPHKAFAVSPSGAWAWKGGHGSNDAAIQRAIAECNVKRTPYTPPCEVINLDGQWLAAVSRQP